MMKNYVSLLIQACNLNYLIMFWFNQQDKKQFAQTILPAIQARDAILVNGKPVCIPSSAVFHLFVKTSYLTMTP